MMQKNYFQLTSLLFILPLFFCISCRKQEPNTLPKNGELGSLLSCDNGIMDGNEEGVDCGALCEPCEFSNNGGCFTLYDFDEKQITTSMGIVTFDEVSAQVIGDNFIAIASNSNGDSITFTFPEYDTMFFKSYNPTIESSIVMEEVYINARLEVSPLPPPYNSPEVLYFESDLNSESNENINRVHLNKSSGKFHISFCELSLKEQSQYGRVDFEGQLNEN